MLCFGEMQAIEEAKEALDGEPGVDPVGDQGQKLGGGVGGGGDSEGPLGRPAMVLGKLSRLFYFSISFCLFEVTAGVLQMGLKARNKGPLCQSRKSGRGRAEGKAIPGSSEAFPGAWFTVQRELGLCCRPSRKALLLFLL